MSLQLENGLIKEEYLPASYCDTSFILDFVSFPLEVIFNKSENNLFDKNEDFKKFKKLLNKYWKSENRILRLEEIVGRIYSYETSTLVYSPLVTLECTEKLVEGSFKDYASKYLSINSIQKSGRKEIGKVLKNIYDDYSNKKIEDWSNLSDLQILGLNLFETGIGDEDDALGLFEIFPVDIKNINILHNTEDFENLMFFSKLQLGVADILHLLVAQKVGCENFITFDSDFVRVKKEIKRIFNLNVLNNVKEIENAI
mgnify:CR=1 FL=1